MLYGVTCQQKGFMVCLKQHRLNLGGYSDSPKAHKETLEAGDGSLDDRSQIHGSSGGLGAKAETSGEDADGKLLANGAKSDAASFSDLSGGNDTRGRSHEQRERLGAIDEDDPTLSAAPKPTGSTMSMSHMSDEDALPTSASATRPAWRRKSSTLVKSNKTWAFQASGVFSGRPVLEEAFGEFLCPAGFLVENLGATCKSGLGLGLVTEVTARSRARAAVSAATVSAVRVVFPKLIATIGRPLGLQAKSQQDR